MATLTTTQLLSKSEIQQEIIGQLGDLPIEALLTLRQFATFLRDQSRQGLSVATVDLKAPVEPTELPLYRYPTVGVPASNLRELVGIMPPINGDALADTEAVYDDIQPVNIVIDSSVLVGLLVPNDTWHHQSVALVDAIEHGGHIGVYFDCVAAEAISTAVRRLFERRLQSQIPGVFERLDTSVPKQYVTWILADTGRLYGEVLSLMQSSLGTLNFNDALIALACRERTISAIASFDRDFDQIPWLRRLADPSDLSDL